MSFQWLLLGLVTEFFQITFWGVSFEPFACWFWLLVEFYLIYFGLKYYLFFLARFWSFSVFYWVLLGFASFYWVLLGFTGFYCVLLGFARFYWVFTEFLVEPTASSSIDPDWTIFWLPWIVFNRLLIGISSIYLTFYFLMGSSLLIRSV